MGIVSRPIFKTRAGDPIDRKNIWQAINKLAVRADVKKSKAHPHAFCHLFAREFYEKKKDVIRLADYLGHSNIEMTRRYTAISTMQAWQRDLELGLLISDTDQRHIAPSSDPTL